VAVVNSVVVVRLQVAPQIRREAVVVKRVVVELRHRVAAVVRAGRS
jgi:hypothetical protein